MVYKFRLISDEIKEFIRDIEILSRQTFYEFHLAIQDDLNFDSSQIASFFKTNSSWEKEKEFTLFDMSDDANNYTIPMDRAQIKDYITEPGQRLIYVFDIFNERVFFVEFIGKKEKEKSTEYPYISYSKGNPPQQIFFSSNNIGSFSDVENFDLNFQEEDSDEITIKNSTDAEEETDLKNPENEPDEDGAPPFNEE